MPTEVTDVAKLASDTALLSHNLALAGEAVGQFEYEAGRLMAQLELNRAELTSAMQVQARLRILSECIEKRKLYLFDGHALICKIWGFGDTGYIEPTSQDPRARFIQEPWGGHRREALIFQPHEDGWCGIAPWCVGYIRDPFHLTAKFTGPDIEFDTLEKAVRAAHQWVVNSTH